MPLPVSATSFLPNPLTGARAQESGFNIGKQSSDFANFVSGALQGASTTAGIINQVQEIQARPGEIARKEQEQQRRERQTKLQEEEFEFEKGDQFEFEKQKSERGFELQEQRINLERKRLAQQASKAAIGRRKEAQELGLETALVQLEQSNIDSLLSEYQNDPGTTTRLLLENDAASDKRRERALPSLSNYIRNPNNPEDKRQQAEQLFESLNDKAFLMDNLKKTNDSFQLLDSNHYPMERSDSVFLRSQKNADGIDERLLRVFDKNGKEKYAISESDLDKDPDRSGKDKDTFFGAGRRIEDYQRKQKEERENPLKQLAEAKARQAGQPLQQERPAKQGPQRQRLQPGDTGVAPAATPAQARQRGVQDQSQVRGGRGREEIASPQLREGERQLRDIAGVRQRGQKDKPVLDPETIQSPLF